MEKQGHELAALRARSATLHNRHQAAEAAFVDAEAELQQYLLEADLDDEKVRSKLEMAVAASALTRDNFGKALAVQQAKVVDAEAKVAAERAAVERNAVADKLERDLDQIEKALPSYSTAANQLAEPWTPWRIFISKARSWARLHATGRRRSMSLARSPCKSCTAW